METKNCNHARRDMEEPRRRQLPKIHASDKTTSRPVARSPRRSMSSYPRISDIFLHDESAWTNRRKWALGEYKTAAERNSRGRRADVVRDVICGVTPLKCIFLGPRMETEKCSHARRDMEEPRQLPRSLPRVSASDKTLCAIARSPRIPRSGYPGTSRSTPGQIFTPHPHPRLS